MPHRRPSLTHEQILAWADDHRRRTGRVPTTDSGSVAAAADETWLNLDNALRKGLRGLPGGDSLARLLRRERGPSGPRRPLSEAAIGGWAQAYREAEGRWPVAGSPPVGLPAGETWKRIDLALRRGQRGLHGGSSLSRLLHREGG